MSQAESPEKKPAANKISVSVLKTLVPLNSLSEKHLLEIAGNNSVKFLKAEKKVFSAGQSDNYRIYLLKGMLVLEYEDAEEAPKLIKGGTNDAKHPIDHYVPHKGTAITKTNAAFLVLKDEYIERYLTMDQVGGFQVDEIDEEDSDDSDDWMTRMLGNKTFSQIPPSNIQAMFIRLESVPAKAGEVIISQGEDGDHFYIVSKGRCEVCKKAKDSDEELKLAELTVGDSFGEEALLASTKRNATVRMITDGALMRLARPDFEELLKEPIIKSVKYDDALSLAKEGHVFLDVRLESEHSNECIEGSLNIPLNILRKKLASLDASVPYIVYCDTGARSSAAAFLLNEVGLNAQILQGGLRSQDAA